MLVIAVCVVPQSNHHASLPTTNAAGNLFRSTYATSAEPFRHEVNAVCGWFWDPSTDAGRGRHAFLTAADLLPSVDTLDVDRGLRLQQLTLRKFLETETEDVDDLSTFIINDLATFMIVL